MKKILPIFMITLLSSSISFAQVPVASEQGREKEKNISHQTIYNIDVISSKNSILPYSELFSIIKNNDIVNLNSQEIISTISKKNHNLTIQHFTMFSDSSRIGGIGKVSSKNTYLYPYATNANLFSYDLGLDAKVETLSMSDSLNISYSYNEGYYQYNVNADDKEIRTMPKVRNMNYNGTIKLKSDQTLVLSYIGDENKESNQVERIILVSTAQVK